MPDILLSDLIRESLAAGMHPSEIRRKLQSLGIRWAYSFAGGVRSGKREQLRRQRQFHLCEECGQYAPPNRMPRMCDDCLAAKWAE